MWRKNKEFKYSKFVIFFVSFLCEEHLNIMYVIDSVINDHEHRLKHKTVKAM